MSRAKPIVAEQNISAPVDVVWQAITDGAQMPKWFFEQIRKHMKLTSALAAEVRLVVRFRPTEANSS